VCPDEIVTDAEGAVFFNDMHHRAVMSISPSGQMSVVLGERSTPEPEATPSGGGIRTPRYMRPIHIALGPDGNAWFARTIPQRQIGRVDGSRIFDVPEDYGDPQQIQGGSDGALWFLTRTTLGRVTAAGDFSKIRLPEAIAKWQGYPFPMFIAAGDGTAWLAAGPNLYQMSARGVLRSASLPNTTIGVQAMAMGCDGSLYIAESVPQIARLAKDGGVEEYPLADYYSIDGLVRAPDCSFWFTAGTNGFHQSVAKFDLVPTVH
jgi:streptogramin lyase